MKRRAITVLLGAILVGIVLAGTLSAPVPYVILGAGPTVDTVGLEKGKPVIQITGREASTSAGQLRLTTVGVVSQTDLVTAIGAWFDKKRAVVPRELIYPPDQDEKQVDQENAKDFTESQSSATTVALRELGYPVQVTVAEVVAGGPSAGLLQVGDVITAVDGKPVPYGSALTAAVQEKRAGSTLNVSYRRAGKDSTVAVTSKASKKGDPPRIGVVIKSVQKPPFTVKIDVGEEIGGPSAGLMFTLGIIDKLTPADLTGGKIIAGTGTINDAGEVGPIGGIAQKLVGAKAAGAKYFLVPADNCAEAKANAVAGQLQARVATVKDGLAALAAIREGRTPPGC